jgi:hypothetical protein
MVERFVKTISGLIRSYVDQYTHDDWDNYIPYMLFAYRSHVHTTTGYSPFYLMFGRDPRLPADMFLGVPPVTEEEFPTPSEQVLQDLELTTLISLLEDSSPTPITLLKRKTVTTSDSSMNPVLESLANDFNPVKYLPPPVILPRKPVAWMISDTTNSITGLRIAFLRTHNLKAFCMQYLPSKLYSYPVEIPLYSLLMKLFSVFNIDLFYIVNEPGSKMFRLPQTAGDHRLTFYGAQSNRHLKSTKICIMNAEKRVTFGTKFPEVTISSPPFYHVDTNGSLWFGHATVDTPNNYRVLLNKDSSVSQIIGTALWTGVTSPILLTLPTIAGLIQDQPTTLVLNTTDNVMDINSANKNLQLRCSDYIQRLSQGMDIAFKVVKEKVLTAQEKLRQLSIEEDTPSYEFRVGDRAWLAVPLEANARSLEVNPKFLFRWAGPVRIVSIPDDKSTSNSQYQVIETFPGREVASRIVHVGRLRPYTLRLPIDDPDAIGADSSDDFQKELEDLKNSRHVKRRPAGLQRKAVGTHPEWLLRFDDEFDPELEEESPLYVIDKIIKHGFSDDRYQYFTKWEGWSHYHNTWQNEYDMPADVIAEYWSKVQVKAPFEYRERQSYLRRKSLRWCRTAPQYLEPPVVEKGQS